MSGTSGKEDSKYGADMNILLTYYHFEDDWKDEKSIPGLAGIHLYKKKAREICEKYPRQSKAIRMQLHNLAVYEKKGETDLDLVAGTFGHLLEELFIMEEDVWEEYLRRFGFYLGKFIYILDAYDDLEKDLEKENYNPLKPMYESFGENQDAYEKEIYQILVMMMAEVGNAYEKLPCLQESEILRNIIYSGVWSKYNKIKKERQEKKEKNGK